MSEQAHLNEIHDDAELTSSHDKRYVQITKDRKRTKRDIQLQNGLSQRQRRTRHKLNLFQPNPRYVHNKIPIRVAVPYPAGHYGNYDYQPIPVPQPYYHHKPLALPQPTPSPSPPIDQSQWPLSLWDAHKSSSFRDDFSDDYEECCDDRRQNETPQMEKDCKNGNVEEDQIERPNVKSRCCDKDNCKYCKDILNYSRKLYEECCSKCRRLFLKEIPKLNGCEPDDVDFPDLDEKPCSCKFDNFNININNRNEAKVGKSEEQQSTKSVSVGIEINQDGKTIHDCNTCCVNENDETDPEPSSSCDEKDLLSIKEILQILQKKLKIMSKEHNHSDWDDYQARLPCEDFSEKCDEVIEKSNINNENKSSSITPTALNNLTPVVEKRSPSEDSSVNDSSLNYHDYKAARWSKPESVPSKEPTKDTLENFRRIVYITKNKIIPLMRDIKGKPIEEDVRNSSNDAGKSNSGKDD